MFVYATYTITSKHFVSWLVGWCDDDKNAVGWFVVCRVLFYEGRTFIYTAIFLIMGVTP